MRLLVVFTLLSIAAVSHAEEWNCRNDLEIACHSGKCELSDEFTAMDVTIDEKGKVSACAYSGCWEGEGKVLKTEDFLVIAAHDLKFSTAKSDDSNANVLVSIDLADDIGVIKAESFAMPLLCTRTANEQQSKH